MTQVPTTASKQYQQNIPRKMQAIGFRRYGSAEVLEPLEVAVPELSANSVLIRVAAAGINPADWRLRNGQFRFFIKFKDYFIPGADVAGVIVAVGSEVKKFRPGDTVFGMLPLNKGGGYAEYAVLSEATIAHLPANFSMSEAAAAPLTALTALQALRDKGKMHAGMEVLIFGASGGVGSYAVQIAKAMGAKVTAVCHSRSYDFVRGLGADEVLTYDTTDIYTAKNCYQIVFDAVGYTNFSKMKPLLQSKGVFVTVNIGQGNPLAKLLARLTGSKKLASLFVKPVGADLEIISNWLATRQVRSLIDRHYTLNEAATAHRYSETERVRGKLVLLVDQQLAANKS